MNNKINKNKMERFKFIGIALATMFILSCSSNGDDPTEGNGNNNGNNTSQPTVITTRLATFEGNGQTIEGDSDINDMQACLFENGKLTQVFKNLTSTDGGYTLNLNRYGGNLYMLANTANVINLDQLKEKAITETDWLKTVFPAQNGKATNFFTGMLTLDGETQDGTTLPLTLKRGVARFDVVVNVAGSASIKSLTLTNVAQSTYLFPQEKAPFSPENITHKDTTCVFNEPLAQSTPVVLYVYEQDNAEMEISAEISFDGGVSRTLTKPLEGALKRNTIYTITIRKDDIDVTIQPNLEDWEQGGDTELAPRVNRNI